MRFPLIHTGRRFFFFTFVVEGRRQVLSRLVRGEKRPQLTEAGERVAALWRSLHQIEPHFTASDFVVMPDHVHLLLIVNSEGEFRFNPLVFAHWFMAATSDGGLTSDGGRCPPNPPALVAPSSLAVVAPPSPADWWRYYEPQGFGGGRPPSFVWSRDYWIDISLDARQLAAIRRYIRMNPARWFWKLDNPDMFRFHAHVRHPALDPALHWSAVGDITLLASPFLYLVRLTMSKTAAELEGEIAAHIERARSGWTPVCGFLSPGEREFERRLKALPHSRWIKTVPYGLPERYDPSVEDSRWLAAHRQLVLSSFDRADIPPFKITRPGCLAMNERIARMVAARDEGVPPPPPGARGARPSVVRKGTTP